MSAKTILEEIAEKQNVEIIETSIEDEDLKGIYCDNTILLNSNQEEFEKTQTLGHELGHHNTLPEYAIIVKDRTFYDFVADAWSYQTILPIKKLIYYYKNHYTIDEILDDCQITKQYFDKIMNYYKDRYCGGIKIQNYEIHFNPTFHIRKIK